MRRRIGLLPVFFILLQAMAQQKNNYEKANKHGRPFKELY